MHDVRYAVRMLAKTPALTAVAALSLALGMGANTAIFSIIDALMLRTLPIAQPDRLVGITPVVSIAMFGELRRGQTVFSGMFAWMGGGVSNYEASGARYTASSETVSGEYFRTLGIQPLLGRLLGPDDVHVESGRANPVAVISYPCWRRRYNGDPNVVGKIIRLEGVPLTIIGVLPERFTGLIVDICPDAIVPIGFKHNGQQFRQAAYQVLARLKPGVTLDQARAQVRVLWPGVLKAAPTQSADAQKRPVNVESAARGNSFLRERTGQPLAILMAVVGAVLLIGCVNLANLMLARAEARRREFGVRVALGAPRSRLLSQVLIESIILSAAGAAIGLAVALREGRLLLGTFWSGLTPLTVSPVADLRVLGFTATVAVITGVLFGLAPAWMAARADPAQAFSMNTRGPVPRSRLAGTLMIGQVALSLILAAVAALFARSLGNLYGANPGYRRDHILAITLFLQAGQEKIPARTAYYHDLIERMRALPGIVSAAYSSDAPGMFYEYGQPVSAPGTAQRPVEAIEETIGPGFFDLVGMRVLEGRDFSWQDDERAPRVALISESLARRLFPKQDPIGRVIDAGSEDKALRIAGVVNSASLWKLQDREPPAVYLALMQKPAQNYPRLNLRTAVAPGSVAESARRVLESMGHHSALFVETIDARLDRMLAAERLIAALSTFFGMLAVLLAAIGLYGITSTAVSRRRPEIGIRMALGAQRGDVLKLVLRDTARVVLAGVAIGVPAAVLAGRPVSAMLYGIAPADPSNLLLSSGVLAAAALLAAWFPARRASRTDPMEALRSE